MFVQSFPSGIFDEFCCHQFLWQSSERCRQQWNSWRTPEELTKWSIWSVIFLRAKFNGSSIPWITVMYIRTVSVCCLLCWTGWNQFMGRLHRATCTIHLISAQTSQEGTNFSKAKGQLISKANFWSFHLNQKLNENIFVFLP